MGDCPDCGAEHGGSFCPDCMEYLERMAQERRDRVNDYAPADADEPRWSPAPRVPLVPHPWDNDRKATDER